MKINVADSLFSINPNFKIGINHYTKIIVSESPQMLKGRLQLFQEQLFFELEDQPITSNETILEWRSLWKQVGADPNRYRPSIEAMLRRIKKRNYLSSTNSAVDLNNLFSLQFKIPIGIYNLEQVMNFVEITIGSEMDTYEGVNGRNNSLHKFIIAKDAKGPFGSPFVDSLRTVVNESTREALHIYFLPPSLSNEKAMEWLKSSGKMFTDISGGDSTSFILTKEQASVIIQSSHQGNQFND